MRYRSRPVDVEAMQWDGSFKMMPNPGKPNTGAEAIVAWVNDNGGETRYEADRCRCGHTHDDHMPAVRGLKVCDHNCGCVRYQSDPRIAVRATADGWAYAAPGWYVVMGGTFHAGTRFLGIESQPITLRAFSVCDPETFEQHWELTNG